MKGHISPKTAPHRTPTHTSSRHKQKTTIKHSDIQFIASGIPKCYSREKPHMCESNEQQEQNRSCTCTPLLQLLLLLVMPGAVFPAWYLAAYGVQPTLQCVNACWGKKKSGCRQSDSTATARMPCQGGAQSIPEKSKCKQRDYECKQFVNPIKLMGKKENKRCNWM